MDNNVTDVEKTAPAGENTSPAPEKKSSANEKSTQELLAEILKYQKRSSRVTRVAAFAVIFIVAVFAAAFVLLIPNAVGFMDHARNSLSEIDKIIAETDTIVADLNSITEEVSGLVSQANVLIDNSNNMVEDNTEAVTETINKLNNMDFETLNKAIKDLSDVVEPMANFFNRFH